MSDDLIKLTAREAVRRLEARDITPLDLIDSAEARIARCEPDLNALPTLCLDRAREHARRLMHRDQARPGASAGAAPSPKCGARLRARLEQHMLPPRIRRLACRATDNAGRR